MSILKNESICPLCEEGRLKEVRKNLIFTYKNRTKKFENENVLKCSVCDYESLSKEDNKKIEKELTDFRRSIDGLLLGNKLKEIRESLSLKKNEMAKLLSVNEKTIGRYENGKITQGEQVDKLYRILQVFPSAANILRPDIRIPLHAFKDHVTIYGKYDYTPTPQSTYNMPDDYFAIDESINAA